MNLLQHEPALRLGCFFAIFFLVAAWEAWAPRRTRDLPRTLRWPNNLGIVLFNTLTLRLLLPAGAVGAAITAEKQGWGLLNQAALPSVIEFLLALVIFDLVIYLQHVMFHAVPALWRLHRYRGRAERRDHGKLKKHRQDDFQWMKSGARSDVEF